MAETESNRDWPIQRDQQCFPYEVISDGQLESRKQYNIAIRMWKRLNVINPDIVILGGYIYPAYWVGFIWAKNNKKKIILWSASNEADHNRNILKEKLKSIFAKKCNAANVYGSKSRDYLTKLGLDKSRIFITGNTTDNSFYYNNTNKFRTKRDYLLRQYGLPAKNFIYIGRFSKEKNIILLLKAYERLKSQNNWGLILIGNGPQRIELINYIEEHNLRHVFMPGFQQKENLPQFLIVSDVFILPSIYEPWGLVVNEAMAAGLPVLVSQKCGCYPDLIDEGVNGFSFDPLDDNNLFELMNNIVNGKYDLEKMGLASLEIIKDYTPEKAAQIISETIKLVST
jgi:glycosyltransferase involved in cell wall biosynthesis